MTDITDPADRLAELAAQVKDGEDAKRERGRLIRALYDADPQTWTQTRLAELGEISQAAVSKLVHQPANSTVMDSNDPAAVIGRWCGVLMFIDEARTRGARRDGRTAISTAWDFVMPFFQKFQIPPAIVADSQVRIDRDLTMLRKRGPAGTAKAADEALLDVYGHATTDIGLAPMTPLQQGTANLALWHQLYTLRRTVGWQREEG
ncbi:hypothetical protein ACGFX7_06055 [Streptomyces harbinensis]|uniref:hypothetical protein n=1 Tax=Streptomyces harbinensis TaxID=1176198 RepID=UPI00371C97B8